MRAPRRPVCSPANVCQYIFLRTDFKAGGIQAHRTQRALGWWPAGAGWQPRRGTGKSGPAAKSKTYWRLNVAQRSVACSLAVRNSTDGTCHAPQRPTARRGCRGRERCAPGDIDEGQAQRPPAQRGQVAEVVGGIGKEAEERAGRYRARPGHLGRRCKAPWQRGGRHGKEQDADRVQQVEGATRRQIGWVCHQMPDALAIERLRDDAEPEKIQRQHHHRSGAIGGEVAQHLGFILLQCPRHSDSSRQGAGKRETRSGRGQLATGHPFRPQHRDGSVRNATQHLRAGQDDSSCPLSSSAIFSSAGFSPAAVLLAAGSLSSSSARISLARRIGLSTSAAPVGTRAAA